MGQKDYLDEIHSPASHNIGTSKITGEYVIETQQDVTAIAEANKRQYNDTPDRYRDVNKVASIPLNVYYDLKRRGIADDPKKFKQWLNDRDNRVFRTRAGTL
jgi:hypothetical protein